MNKGTPWSVSTRYLYEQAMKHMFIPDIQDRGLVGPALAGVEPCGEASQIGTLVERSVGVTVEKVKKTEVDHGPCIHSQPEDV